MKFLFLVAIFLNSKMSFSQAQIKLKDYLAKSLPESSVEKTLDSDDLLLLKNLELRISATGGDLTATRVRMTPFGWTERENQKNLTQLERDLYASQMRKVSTARVHEVAKKILAFYIAQQHERLLLNIQAASGKLVKMYESNLGVLAEKPENYIKALEERLSNEENLKATENQIESLNAILATIADLPNTKITIDFEGIISIGGILKKLAEWSHVATNPSMQLKNILVSKYLVENKIEIHKRSEIWNYLEIESTYKKNGDRDKLEFGLGVNIPILSGEYKAKEFSTQNKLAIASDDLQRSQSQENAEIMQLRSTIIYRIDQQKNKSTRELENRIQKIQQRIVQQLGPASAAALNISLALEKLRLRRWESISPVWGEYLDLAEKLGNLDSHGLVLLSPQHGAL